MENPKIRFKGFTKDWEQRKLGDVIDDMYNGQTPSRNKSEYWNGTIKWLSSGELNRGTVYDSIETITEEGQKAANLKIVPKGTFVMAITGLEAAGTRGNCALLGFDTTLNQSCMALFPKQEMLTSEFLFQWYRKVGEEYGINYTQGTKQQSYNAELIKILPISLPSVVEQRKISSYLSHLDHLITLHQRKCEQTKKLKKYMLQKMFPQNGAKVPEIRFYGFTYDWEQRKLGDMGSTFTGLSGKTKEDFGHGDAQFITYMNVFSNPVANLEMTEAVEIDAKQNRVKKGDVFFTTSSETPEEVGMSCVMPENKDNIYLNSFCFGYRPTEKFDLDYLAYVLRADSFRKEMTFLAQGISRYNISKNKVMEVSIPIPNLEEQTMVGHYFSNLDHLITLHQRKCDELKKMKKYMLQNMFI